MVMQKAIRLLTDLISVQLSKNKILELFWTVIKLSKTSDGQQLSALHLFS